MHRLLERLLVKVASSAVMKFTTTGWHQSLHQNTQEEYSDGGRSSSVGTELELKFILYFPQLEHRGKIQTQTESNR